MSHPAPTSGQTQAATPSEPLIRGRPSGSPALPPRDALPSTPPSTVSGDRTRGPHGAPAGPAGRGGATRRACPRSALPSAGGPAAGTAGWLWRRHSPARQHGDTSHDVRRPRGPPRTAALCEVCKAAGISLSSFERHFCSVTLHPALHRSFPLNVKFIFFTFKVYSPIE